MADCYQGTSNKSIGKLYCHQFLYTQLGQKKSGKFGSLSLCLALDYRWQHYLAFLDVDDEMGAPLKPWKHYFSSVLLRAHLRLNL